MSDVTYDEMAMAALKLAKFEVNNNNVRSLVIWACSENDYVDIKTKALWNPWDTTEQEPNATDFNPQGVKNYPDIVTGLKAWHDTLFNGYYDGIISCLNESQPPAVTCEAIAGSKWGSKPSTSLVVQVLADWTYYSNLLVGGSDNQPVQKATFTAPVVQPKVIEINPELAKVLSAINTEISDIHQLSGSGDEAQILDTIKDEGGLHTHISELSDLITALEKELS